MSPTSTAPTLIWLRRDFRLDDHPALCAAVARGGPVIPVFILDPETEALGAAHRWRLGQALRVFAAALAARGSRLIVRRGPALASLRALVQDTGAQAVHWSRLYDGAARARDAAVKAALTADGIAARSFNGAMIHEPWELSTKTGGAYKVYSPFARAAHARPAPPPIDPPGRLRAPHDWPASEHLEDWHLGADLRGGAGALAVHAQVGEDAAARRLAEFMVTRAERYKEDRDRLDRCACSGLSENLAFGEISARRIWALAADQARGGRGIQHFLSEILWREFACHLIVNSPQLETGNWRPEWDAFPWRGDNADAERWRRGQTGVDVIDAAMRELYASGTMHNRARMLVASYLTKHLMTDWQVGAAWFRDTLIDWDPAANAMGWQWAAGSGPDASPFFRIFNPEIQAEKFDPDQRYRTHWLTGEGATQFLSAAPRHWGLSAGDPRPTPIIGLKEGRARALSAYHDLKAARDAA